MPSAARLSAAVIALLLCSLATGCSLSPLARHAAAFSTAAAPVIDGAESAYAVANKLHQRVVLAARINDYDKNMSWRPAPPTDDESLLTARQLEARKTVLEGLRSYAATLVAITSKTGSKDENAAASNAGSNLAGLAGTVGTDFPAKFPNLAGISGASSEVSAGASVAFRALGDYLIANKVKASLPKVTAAMNPNIEKICELLKSDLNVLISQSDVDYQRLMEERDQLIRHSTQADLVIHHNEIAYLITLAEQKQVNKDNLVKLQGTLMKLELTHQALAAAAQGNNPESFRQKLGELEAEGRSLSDYFNALPAVVATPL